MQRIEVAELSAFPGWKKLTITEDSGDRSIVLRKADGTYWNVLQAESSLQFVLGKQITDQKQLAEFESYCDRDRAQDGVLRRQARPSGVCTRCRKAYGYDAIGGTCRKPLDRAHTPCGGGIISTVEADWEECPSCNATGYQNNSRCSQCEGDGWLCVKRGMSR